MEDQEEKDKEHDSPGQGVERSTGAHEEGKDSEYGAIPNYD